MKQSVLIALLLASALSMQAQIPRGNVENSKGDKHLNFGIGASGWGLPLYIQYEKMLYNELSVGGELNVRMKNEKYISYEYSHKMIAVGVIGNYNVDKLLDIPSHLDLYAGAALGYIYVKTTATAGSILYTGNYENGIYVGARLGGRYYFSTRWAANSELEFGTTLAGIKLGATYRF